MAINLNTAGPGAEHPDDALLEEARMNADADWAEELIASLLVRRKRHGANFSMSDRERELVERISEYGK